VKWTRTAFWQPNSERRKNQQAKFSDTAGCGNARSERKEREREREERGKGRLGWKEARGEEKTVD